MSEGRSPIAEERARGSGWLRDGRIPVPGAFLRTVFGEAGVLGDGAGRRSGSGAFGTKRREADSTRFEGDSSVRSQEVRPEIVEQGDPGSGDRYQALNAEFIGRILDAAELGGNRLFFCSVAWELGQDLLDRQEYELAARCFDRLSSFAVGVADHLVVEAARAAWLLCSALGGEQTLEEGLQEASKLLRQDLAHLTFEEVNAATAALASYARGDALDSRILVSPTSATDVTMEVNVLRSAPVPKAGGRPAGDRRSFDRRKAPARPDVPARIELEVRFFGRFEILHGGRALPLGRNVKARTILKYLLAQAPRPVSRDCLMGWLWPESDPRRARWSLNSAMYAVRRLLSEGLYDQLVLCEVGHYSLSPNVSVSSDVREFEARYRNGRLLEEAGQASEAAAEYEAAAELYRDDYMIEDLYEDWTLIERERLSDAYMDVLDRLARHYAESGQAREAINACYRALENDPGRESTYRLLMKCYARLGLRHRALQQYRLTEEILGSRYGTSPSQQTRALYRNLLRGMSI